MKFSMRKTTAILAFSFVLLFSLENTALAQDAAANSAPAVSTSSDATAAVPPDTMLGSAVPTDTASPAALPPEVLILKKIESDLKEKYKKEIYIPPSIPSLIYTPSQQSLLREARNGFNTKISTEVDTPNAGPNTDLQQPAGISVRTLSLGGIVFLNPDDWTIWLNNRRVTPDKMPTQAIDLRVYRDFIELRWFDAQTNQIFPIRLRPNQTFNLDAHTFVPG